MNVNEAIAALVGGTVKVVSGSYTGDGSSSRKISLDFTPKLVFIDMPNGATAVSFFKTDTISKLIYISGSTSKINYNTTYLTVSKGFNVSSNEHPNNYDYATSNINETVYQYIAIG